MIIGKWQKDKAYLRALKMEIPLNKGQEYRDAGYTGYISPPLFSFDYGYGSKGSGGIILGACFRSEDLANIEIEYLKKTPMPTLFVRGHEEGHAIFYLGRLSQLYKEAEKQSLDIKLTGLTLKKAQKHDRTIEHIIENKKELGDRSYLNMFGNRELLSHFTGILSLKKKGYSNKGILNFIRREGRDSPPLSVFEDLFALIVQLKNTQSQLTTA